MQYKKDKHMQAYLMGGKKKINVWNFYVFPRKTQKGNSELLITQSLVQTRGGGIPTEKKYRTVRQEVLWQYYIPSQKNYHNGIIWTSTRTRRKTSWSWPVPSSAEAGVVWELAI